MGKDKGSGVDTIPGVSLLKNACDAISAVYANFPCKTVSSVAGRARLRHVSMSLA